MNKTKTIASGCWYAARHRAIPYILSLIHI